ncbi:MAG: serine/threonine protein kinase [Planctomycetes bacterium]|nr:serine/threonine protein kinase [Planctomycetota bacterium]
MTQETHVAELKPNQRSAERALVDSARLDAEKLSAVLFHTRRLPDSFAGYDVVREIHSGSQGVVYEAVEQSTGRKVAVKVLHEGPFAGAHNKTRFEREVQILAQLRHPNIVAVRSSGVVAGSSYFVMDYIAGQPLDAFMESCDHPLADTLRLFAQICEAVNAAHLHGVIHRDLKPGNIRIDADGEPHILDFGLAKMTFRELIDQSHTQVATCTGQFVGSLPWASPEQAAGESDRVDIRTDVYSLGVILYQMLTSRFPYGVTGNMRDILDNITHAEPTRPSRIRRQINDEIETIVLTALDKAPERRYQSAGELGRDVRRYLAGEPIQAKPHSSWYIIRKTVHRHRVPAAVTCAFMLVLGTFGGAALMMRQRAVAAEQKARDIQLAFVERTLASIDPGNIKLRNVQRVEDLEAVAQRVELELEDHPKIQAGLFGRIGNVYRRIGILEAAREHLEAALTIRRQIFEDDAPEVAASLHDLSALYWDLGDYESAESLYREALATRRAVFGDQHAKVADTLNHLAACLASQGDYRAAEASYREALEMRRKLFGDDDPEVAATRNNLATCLMEIGEYDEALGLFEEALEAVRNLETAQPLNGREKPQYVPRALTSLGACLVETGDYDRAEPLLTEALIRKREQMGNEHRSVASTLHWLARLAFARGDSQAAQEQCSQALDIRRKVLPESHPHLASSLMLHGMIQLELDEPAAAEPFLVEALDIRTGSLPPNHWRTAQTKNVLGGCLARLDRFETAEGLLLNSWPIIRDTRGPDDRYTREARGRIVELYESLGDPDEADRYRNAFPDPAPP